ncbi:TIGR01548 family HAD-type hydrolase [Oscillatoria sp. CS-180]|uniref:TIGR01548 family HAD-type hydrolase n=1 Tax=Oscillatoria sp. CS-180 TaxID=3021720 RepID=UPI00232D3F4C|nr:TIGR01548 family HAD-type hydrolase [Oscillatoria sp. CS-180]MDB9527962.1 TIGR01548 family HAD-type hydrolase [Oscillatoria sp. CS-180]
MKAIAIFDIDGVIRDVSGSYRRALADTVERYTDNCYRPTSEDIDALKSEGAWNNDWDASQELIYRYFESQAKSRSEVKLEFEALVDFFQKRYRGPVLDDPTQWTGYIAEEPLLIQASYFEQLTQGQVAWGFFSGATRGSALFVLKNRIGLAAPLLIAMHDAPGKPDPTGLFQMADQLNPDHEVVPVLYAGDTVADMQTVLHACQQRPEREWIGVGILPPHVVRAGTVYAADYSDRLTAAGAKVVLPSLSALTPAKIEAIAHLQHKAEG